MNSKGLRKLQLEIDEVLDCNPNPKQDEKSTLEKLLLSIVTTLEFLQMGLSCLELVKSCPSLSILQISVCASGDNAEAVLKYLGRLITCLDLRLNNLKYVVINCYECSKTELLFTKLLFA
ncbi:hypothetical protein RDI58_001536 [Solanum bulbocastanum]|uniref:Uncharacterized protein n=1 Tax=Solanum bulbocastanum TaxID=147425 RepID=A0AAN8U2U8_SOLBU